MRLVLAIAVFIAAMAFGSRPGQASGNAPWCAVVSTGNGEVIWDCHYRSVEECRPNVIAGNRGFCNVNPAWPGLAEPQPAGPRKHHKRHVNRD